MRVITVVLTPPVLPTLLQSLRVLRVLRILRLLRLGPIFRRAFTLQGFKYASVFTALVALTGAAAFENAEPGKDFFDGIYRAVATMADVGYGDELPTTTEARIVAMALMVVGIGYLAVVTGAVADRFVDRREEQRVEAIEAESPDDLAAQIDRLAVRASELATELEALRTALPPGARRVWAPRGLRVRRGRRGVGPGRPLPAGVAGHLL